MAQHGGEGAGRARARADAPPPVPVSRGDLRALERLYQVGVVLSGFESVEATVPRLLRVLGEVVPLSTAVLCVRGAAGRRTYAWMAERACTRRVVEAEQSAWRAYAYLVPSDGEDDDASVVAERLPGARPCSAAPLPNPYLALPLTLDRGAFGVFQLEVARPASPSELRFVNAVVDQLAQALARDAAQRAEREARRDAESMARRLAELQGLAEVLLESKRLDDTLPTVMERIAALFAAEIGVLMLADEGGQVLRLRAAVGMTPGAAGHVRFGEGISGRIATEGPTRLEDVMELPGLSEKVRGYRLRALVGVPLRVHGAVIGVLEVASRQRRRFTEEDQQLLEFVASRLVVALEHARLFDLEQQFRHALEEISGAAVRISDALVEVSADPDCAARSFEAIADAARAVIHGDHAGLCVYEGGAQPRPPLVTGLAEAVRADARHRLQAAALLKCVAQAPLPVREAAPHAVAKPAQTARFPAVGPFLGVNARYRGRLVGTLYVARTPGAPPFTATDQRVLELLAAHVGVALETARLTAELGRDRARLEESVRMRELMAAIVSHDLKNPLATIRMSCDLMLHDRGASLISAQARPHLERIRRSADRMRQLTQDLLDVSRIEAGQLAVSLEPVRAAAIVEEVMDQFGPLAAQKSLELRRRIAEPELVISGDRERLAQALGNLVANAVKFTAHGEVSISVERRDGEAWFTVSDTGPGINAEHLPHIFDRYWQAEATSRAGSGLGLSIAKGIAERHGGRIWASSVVGEGSTFVIAVPLSAAPVAPQPEAHAS